MRDRDSAVSPYRRASDDAEAINHGTLPRHIAIIMDGNGRWAQRQRKPRTFGHQRGAEVARQITLEASRLGIEALTLYSFSTENWKRPREEVEFLMELGHRQLQAERETIHRSNIRFRHIGSRAGLSHQVLAEFDELHHSTASNTGMTLALALNYGSRAEMVEATREIARDASDGRLDADAIDERLISSRLYTAGLPDPDLLIRTAGEMRLSNFLLWQISYSELWVTPTYWPEFSTHDLHEAINEFGRRRRRFGGIESE